jgi:hypothetical protein
MDVKLPLLAAAIALSASTTALAASSVTYTFSQTGFVSGGTVTGTFTGTDVDGDGQLYAASQFAADMGVVEFGNELEYAELTLEGFFEDPVTLVYDASVADMTAFESAFMAFSYNLDGGSFGDEADEGWSFQFFAPSFNYILGERFAVYSADTLPTPTIGSCGSDLACSAVIAWVPDDNPTGIEPRYLDTSSALTVVEQVPVPGAVWLMASALGLLGTARGRRASRG